MANMASACALVMSASDSAKLLGPLRYWRHRQAASTCILVTISAVCVCILVVCGVLLAREYSADHSRRSADPAVERLIRPVHCKDAIESRPHIAKKVRGRDQTFSWSRPRPFQGQHQDLFSQSLLSSRCPGGREQSWGPHPWYIGRCWSFVVGP